MSSLCGADCGACPWAAQCAGCSETCGSPFGGVCMAAQTILSSGRKAYPAQKQLLLQEINHLLSELGLPLTDCLLELRGVFVNLEYPMPDGSRQRLLNDNDIYLGCRIASETPGLYYGVVANQEMILVSRYRGQGQDPRIILRKSRSPRADHACGS